MNTFSPFPFIRYTIALSVGIGLFIWIQYFTLFLWIVLGITSLALVWAMATNRREISGILSFLFLAQTGYLFAYQHTPILSDKTHFAHTKTHITYYVATVNSIVEEKQNSWKTVASVEQIHCQNTWSKASGNVLLYLDKHQIRKPLYGDRLLLKGSPQLVAAPKNPNEFDYQWYLAQQGIYHQQYARDTNMVYAGHSTPSILMALAYRVNAQADSLLTQNIGSKTEYGVANAMILGLRDDLDSDLMQAYSAAGAIHVLSVSGLHVGVIFVLLSWLLGGLKKSKHWGKWLFMSLVLIFLWFYAFVTGLSSPVLRSTFMFSLMLIAETFNRKHNAYNTVAFSAFWLLIYQPYFLINVGFQLSYLAVLGMIHIQPLLNPLIVIDKNKNWLYWLADRLWKVSTVSVAAQIATFPITIYYFHQFPNLFLLANPIVILLSSVALCVGLGYLLLGFFIPIQGLHWGDVLLEWSLKLLNDSVLFTEKLPYSLTSWLHVEQWEVIMMYVVITAFLLLVYTRHSRWLGVAGIALLGLFISNISQFFQLQTQHRLVVHAIPKHIAISLVEGKKAILLADSSFLKNAKDIRYRLNNFWSAQGIVDTTCQTLETSQAKAFLWQQKTFLIVGQLHKNQAISLSNQTIDYLIVSNKNIKALEQVAGINYKNLIVDASNGQYWANKLNEESIAQGIPCYNLYRDGALILSE
jgi:competence protein ComEC